MGKRTMNRQSVVVTYTFKARKNTDGNKLTTNEKRNENRKKEGTQTEDRKQEKGK
jgi:hypothetical protein